MTHGSTLGSRCKTRASPWWCGPMRCARTATVRTATCSAGPTLPAVANAPTNFSCPSRSSTKSASIPTTTSGAWPPGKPQPLLPSPTSPPEPSPRISWTLTETEAPSSPATARSPMSNTSRSREPSVKRWTATGAANTARSSWSAPASKSKTRRRRASTPTSWRSALATATRSTLPSASRPPLPRSPPPTPSAPPPTSSSTSRTMPSPKAATSQTPSKNSSTGRAPANPSAS